MSARSTSRLAAAAALLLVFLPGLAAAQPMKISIGKITAEQRCTVYQESEGASALVVTDRALAAVSTWRTWLVKDCVDNFPSLRTSLSAALAGSGKFVVTNGGGDYVLSARISDVSGDGQPRPTAPNPGRDGYAVATGSMLVNLDITLTDRSGAIVYGGMLSKEIETGYDTKVDNFRAYGSSSGQAMYTKLQHEVALAATRKIAFHLFPLRVTGGDGRTIRLNYGAPLLTLGTMVQATSPDGGTVVRYSVTSSDAGSAIAEREGDGNASRIVPGSSAIVIEPEDPAANARRFRRVELP